MTTQAWVLVGVLMVMFIVMCVALIRVARRVRQLVSQVEGLASELVELRTSAESFAPLLADTRSALRKSQNERLRADDLIQTATSLTGRVDSATKLALSVVTNPIVRILSTFSGLRRGINQFVKRSGSREGNVELHRGKPRRELTSRGGRRGR